MKKIGNLLYVLVLILSCVGQSALAESRVTASVDRAEMGIGDAFTLTVTVVSDEEFEAQIPQLPRISGIEEINSVVGARQSSSRMSIINGKTQFQSQTTQEYQFLLSPQKEGRFVIPAIDVSINNQIYKTQPIQIQVAEEHRNSAPQNPRGRPRFPPGFGQQTDEEPNPFGSADPEDLFEQLLQQQQRMFGQAFGGRGLPQAGQGSGEVPSQNLDINTKDAFFVYLDVDKKQVFEGEQVTANWYIYTRANIDSLDRVKFPDLKGFWKEIIEEVPALQFSEEIVNGVRYRKALLASHALFPIKPGSSIIDEFKIKAKVRTPNQFGQGKPYDVTKASKRTEIKVLPLPEEGKTLSFSGAIGQYQVTAKTDELSYPAHQPFSIKIRYEGMGNAKLIDLPAINWPQGLEVYDTKSDSKFFKEGQSFKEFEILVIPRQEGSLTIPTLQFTYFDPTQKKYITQETQAIDLQITAGSPSPAGAARPAQNTGDQKDEEKFVAQPILLWPEAQFNLGEYRLWLYALVILIGTFIILIPTLRALGQLSFQSESVQRIQTKMNSLEQLVKSGDQRRIGAEATNLIYLLVAQLAGQKKADQEMYILIREIPLNEQKKYLDKINNLFDYFQLLGFSPDEIMRGVIEKNSIEGQLKELKKLSQEIVDKIKKEDKTIS